MAKLYTRTGDQGKTALFDGTRVNKDDPRVEAYGLVDELNAHLGVAIALLRQRKELPKNNLAERLLCIQNDLFTLGAELATPAEAGSRNRDRIPSISAEQVPLMESWIDEAAAAVAPLTGFVLPGGDLLAAQLHVCRTVCRRAERRVVTLAGHVQHQQLNPQIVIYLNRLSDLLFAWARLVNRLAGVPDEPWAKP